MHDIWTAEEAQTKFSEVLDRALSDGPQTITRNGKPTAVIVSAEEWARVQRPKREGTLADFFANSPLRESGVEIERPKDVATPPDL
jgi:prevent-host-death family protein